MASKQMSATTFVVMFSSLVQLANARLPQDITNGGSLWGTLDAPRFPDFLQDNPLPSGYPWGSRTGVDNDPYSPNTPETGVTRYYDFDLTQGVLAPDGYLRSGIFVNGQFPGPAIEANWGDWIELKVHNNIFNTSSDETEGTTIHFHGLSQKGTSWYDGVPGVTQCPIAPGASFTYRVRADVYGSSWWHSHFSAQYTAGAFGPLIIYGPKQVDYDVDVGPVMVGDYYHSEYRDVVAAAASNSTIFNVYVPWSDNTLINGKNNYNCSSNTTAPEEPCDSNAGLAQFRFSPGKTHRLRLMNTGAAALIHFSIDGHKMLVVSQDFEPLVPYEADFVTLHVAQRTDILVVADADPKATYWMRSSISLNCSVAQNTQALGKIAYDGYYANASNGDAVEVELATPSSNQSAPAAAADVKSFLCKNDDLSQTVPLFPKPFDPNPTTVETINIDFAANATGHHVWTMNNVTQYTNYNAPALLQAYEQNFTFPDPKANVYDFGSNKTVRIVLNTNIGAPHPMHLHGHSFQVLAQGPGVWDGTLDASVSSSNNPPRRDVQVQPRLGHLVIQFTIDNPGVWSYHCHIAWHASQGFNLVFLELPQELAQAQVPFVIDQTCVDWKAWTDTHFVDQIDAGI